MAMFPASDEASGMTGALAKGGKLLSSVLSNPAYFGMSGRRLTLTVCGGSRKNPQIVAIERPAALEKVQFHEKTHLFSYLGYGIQRTGC